MFQTLILTVMGVAILTTNLHQTFAIVACFGWLSNQKSQTIQLSYIAIMIDNCKVGQVIKNNHRSIKK